MFDTTGLQPLTLPPLIVATGRVVVVDATAFDTDPREAFPQPVPEGRWPVEAFVRRVPVVDGEQPQIALVRVRFAEDAVASWTPAGTVAVDTGVAAVMDALAYEILLEDRADHFADPAAEHEEPDIHRELLFAMDGPGPVCRAGAIPILVEDDPPTNIVGFHSGPGDGVYACHWGIAAEGHVAQLVIDFGGLARS